MFCIFRNVIQGNFTFYYPNWFSVLQINLTFNILLRFINTIVVVINKYYSIRYIRKKHLKKIYQCIFETRQALTHFMVGLRREAVFERQNIYIMCNENNTYYSYFATHILLIGPLHFWHLKDLSTVNAITFCTQISTCMVDLSNTFCAIR